jgi:hypothetical protein
MHEGLGGGIPLKQAAASTSTYTKQNLARVLL